MRNLGDLLLKDKEAEGLLGDLLNLWSEILDVLRGSFRFDVILVDISGQRTGAIGRSDNTNINDVVRLYTLGVALCSVLSELESPYEVTLVENIFIDSRVIKIDNIRVQVLPLVNGPVFSSHVYN